MNEDVRGHQALRLVLAAERDVCFWPISAARLQELRCELDASLTVVADNGSAIIVWVVPGGLPPFFMIIDPDNLPPPETAH